MQPGLTGFRTVQFLVDTAAGWAASTRALAANQFAIISDDPTRFKRGEGLASLQSGAKTFSQLPYYNRADAALASPIVYSSTTGITAHAGGGQANAVQLATEFNEVTVCATSGDSVKLPSAAAGLKITVKNVGAQALAVFPFAGDSINALAANQSVLIAPGITKTFFAQDTVVWQESTGPASVNRTPAAINATATASAAQVATGAITSTSAAATSITLPTATLLAAFLGAAQGTSFDFIVDNSAGANIVTVIVGAGITKVGIGLLTVPVGEIAVFRIYFTSTTTAVLNRIGADEAADVVALTDNSTGASGGNTIAAVTDTPSAANAIATLAAKVNALRTALVNAGIML